MFTPLPFLLVERHERSSRRTRNPAPPPPPRRHSSARRVPSVFQVRLVAACSAAPGVFQVRCRFPAGGGAAALRAHDGRRHGRLLAAADLPLGGLSLPTDTGYVRAPDDGSSC